MRLYPCPVGAHQRSAAHAIVDAYNDLRFDSVRLRVAKPGKCAALGAHRRLENRTGEHRFAVLGQFGHLKAPWSGVTDPAWIHWSENAVARGDAMAATFESVGLRKTTTAADARRMKLNHR